MKINETFHISQRTSDKAIVTNLLTGKNMKTYSQTDTKYRFLNRAICICRKRTANNVTKNHELRRIYSMLGLDNDEIELRLFDSDESADSIDKSVFSDDESRRKEKIANMLVALDKLNSFFSEFGFSLSHRFVNTFGYATDKKEFVKNYFTIQDHPYAAEIVDKIQSAEFNDICKNINNPEAPMINTRFTLFFGEPGTGKTTEAMKLADKCIVCSSDMLPSDLMQNFAFSDGKAEFQKSDLWIAMEEGKTIVLDEINMLPFESLRFLQGITDNKNEIDYKGFNIKIANGFQIIGTMNLNVNGQCIPLPAPLADRCINIKEFKLNSNDLINSLMIA